MLGNVHHLLHRLARQQVLIVQVVVEDVNPLLHVVDLGFVRGGCNRLDVRDGGVEQIDNGLGRRWNVRAVALGVFRSVRLRRCRGG